MSHTFGLAPLKGAEPIVEIEKHDEDMSKDTTKISTFSKKGFTSKLTNIKNGSED